MYPFERFTELAKKTLTLAQEEAERNGRSYIGTEHLLIGLLATGEGTAHDILSARGIEIGTVRARVEAAVGQSERIIIQQIVPTSRVKKVIEIAFEESRQMAHGYVSTGELLLGLMLEGEGIAAHVLEELGLDEQEVREKIEKASPERGVPRQAQPVEPGARVLVHDPTKPYRLWEGRVARLEGGQVFIVEVEDRPAGREIPATANRIHPVPTSGTFNCPYCRDHL